MDGKHLDASESVWGGAESTALMVMENENESSGVPGSNEGYETMMMDGGASEHYLDNSARLGERLSDYVRLEEPPPGATNRMGLLSESSAATSSTTCSLGRK